MSAKAKAKFPEAQNPLILRSHRLMEAFAKSDDERDFYLDRIEGFIIYVDLDKSEEELLILDKELRSDPDRYCMVPKLTFFETKKIMEGFVHEKVYDIDTKEKLLDIIQSREARENFLEFIYDQHTELEKWQQYYQERSRIRIIEWLRHQHYHFVFEEDLELSTSIMEKLKQNLFEKKVGKELEVARKSLVSKSKTYYSNEALNPRPKRGRPPKQAQKMEMEPQVTSDIYTTVPQSVRPFLFTPEISSALDITFSSRFETGQELMAHRKQTTTDLEDSLNDINQNLAALRQISSRWIEKDNVVEPIIEKEEELFVTLDEEDQALFQKLKERKPSKKSPQPEKSKPVAAKTVKKLSLKQEKPKADKKIVEPKMKALAPAKKNKKEPVKRIMPKPVKKPATLKKTIKAAPKNALRRAKTITKKPAIKPKTAPAKLKTRPKK